MLWYLSFIIFAAAGRDRRNIGTSIETFAQERFFLMTQRSAGAVQTIS